MEEVRREEERLKERGRSIEEEEGGREDRRRRQEEGGTKEDGPGEEERERVKSPRGRREGVVWEPGKTREGESAGTEEVNEGRVLDGGVGRGR
jgi:hypothetical protein